MKDKAASLGNLTEQLAPFIKQAKKHVAILFMLLLAAVYGFVVHKIGMYSNVQPGSGAISAKVKTLDTPHIDQSVVAQLQKLKDNSVNVKSLFDQARTNPFKE